MQTLWRALVAIGNWRLISMVKFAAILGLIGAVLVSAGLLWAGHYPFAKVPGADPVSRIVYLGQGWGPDAASPKRQLYYYTPQGTAIKNMRYAWFVNLEKAWSSRRFAAPENLAPLGFIIDAQPTPKNPDRLPVGFTRHFDPQTGDYLLDITCAACHSGELHYTVNHERVAVRIDGGQALHAFTSLDLGQFGPSLMASMAATYLNPFKFDSFAHRVLGTSYSSDRKSQLRADFGKVLWATAKQGFTDKSKHLYPVEEGFGRTDAIGRISNEVFATSLDEANYRVADAPVSYPPVWNIWKFDWVQYTASVAQPLARNLGESLGVGADPGLLTPYNQPVPAERRFVTTARIDDLVAIEWDLKALEQPEWPEAVFGAVDKRKAETGGVLYGKYCAHCHQPCELPAETRAVETPLRKDGEPYWRIRTLPVEAIGTDPAAARNFATHRVSLEKSGLTDEDVRPLVEKILRERERRANEYRKSHKTPAVDQSAEIAKSLAGIDVKSASIGAGLNFIGIKMRDLYFADHNVPPERRQIMEGDGALDIPQVIMAYKARPLGGMWASPPFLHNGSVATLYELLGPAEKRRKHFFTGRKDFDPKYIGIPMNQPKEGFDFDTSIPGNLNAGHEFKSGFVEGAEPKNGVIGPELTDDQRWALIEYLKIHRDSEAPACETKPVW